MSEMVQASSLPQISDIYSLHLLLFSDADALRELWLPAVPEGFFHFSEGAEYRFLSISAKNGQWVATCKRPAFFRDVALEYSYEAPLTEGAFLPIEYDDQIYTLYAEKVLQEGAAFRNYAVPSDAQLRIGSHPDCDIFCDNAFLAGTHAVLRRCAGQWSFARCDRGLGVYVNGRRRDCADLRLGDVLYMVGLKIIIGTDFISLHHYTGKISVNPDILHDITPMPGIISRYYDAGTAEPSRTQFNRSPRKRMELSVRSVSVEAPPMSMSQKQLPLMLRMGSSMLSGGVAAFAGNFTSLISGVLFPFLSSKYTDSQRREYEQLRLSKYTEYLQKKQQEIADAIAEEQVVLNRKYPSISSVLAPGRLMTQLWERRPGDSDFLQLRIGAGTQPLKTAINYPNRRFELEPDALEEQMYAMVEKPYHVENVPLVLSLTEMSICGITGTRELVIELIRQLVLQTAIFHSYDEVKLIFLLTEQELAQLSAIRYLPHVWDNQRSTRFIATNEADAYALGEHLKAQIIDNAEKGKNLAQLLKNRPYYLIFALDKRLFDSHEAFKQLLQYDYNPGVSIITAHDALPKETQQIINLSSAQSNTCTTLSADGGDDILFALDTLSPQDAATAMSTLANVSLKQAEKAQSMPKMLTFLEMFRVGRIEQLNPLKRWRENNPVKSLSAPVGVGEDGALFPLDLHEKRQGPHGLVAGMTGSGKSEFIITYILSMAVNYHPDEVAFVLIDYKGGGLAGAFENPQTGVRLPHLVGTITNLDGASIQRSLMSIESELRRRQRIFNEVKSAVNEGTMDIYSYQKLYREGRVSEPIPHLFIVSDEFAELKQQRPEFMDSLISAARIGRSLGVHLILATQKPSGVVNDQIRSNTKFRVCLRVQERSDSMDMLKRPEAAELTDTGRFYLQVGYNEYFALGQSAWCGAAYEPQDVVPTQRDDSVDFLDITGQVIAQAKPKVRKSQSGLKQIVAVVQYLDALAKKHGIHTRPLWQPELPTGLDLEQLQREHPVSSPMSVCLGLLDDPENQRQFPLTIDFETCGNLLIAGDSGSGKTTAVQSILYSLARQLSPGDFHFYGLDYSSRMLKQFKPLPHCGAILLEEDAESLDEFFKLINQLVAERKKLFSQLEVDNFREARKRTQLPLVIVFVDNYSGLGTTKIGENHGYKFPTYLKNSDTYGIKYIITCSSLNEVPSKARQSLPLRIATHMKDKYEYGDALNSKVTYTPPERPGRGMFVVDERPLEFQGVILGAEQNESSRLQQIKELAQSARAQYGSGPEVRRMPVLSETATYEDFSRQFKRGRVPLCYDKRSGRPIAMPLKQFSALSLYFGNPLGVGPVLSNMLHAAEREEMRLWIVKRQENSVFDGPNAITAPEDAAVFDLSGASLENLRKLLLDQTMERSNMIRGYCEENHLDVSANDLRKTVFPFLRANTEPIMLLIEDYADFCAAVDFVSTLIFDKCLSKAGMYNIYAVAGFAPGNAPFDKNRALYYGFNPDGNILLLGGRFDQQDICTLPEARGLEKALPYNVGLMYYQSKFHPILVPCGEIIAEEVDEDEQSIF